MRKLHFFFVLTLFFTLSELAAQPLSAYQRRAEETYKAGDYSASLAYNEVLLQIDSNDIKALHGAAQSARMLDIFELSVHYFQKLLAHPNSGLYPDATFYLATAYKSDGDYAAATEQFDKFVRLVPEDYPLRSVAEEEADNCQWASSVVAARDSQDLQHLDEKVNTVLSDFAPRIIDGAIFYTSAWRAKEEEEPVNRIYRYDEGAPKGEVVAGNPEKDEVHAAHFVVSPFGKRKYLNHCTDLSNGSFRCRLLCWAQQADGSEKLVEFPAPLNLDSFTTTQPAVAVDETGNEILFFVSDRRGGKGGLDIWYTTIGDDGTVGDIKNLDAVNTVGDDVTPFFHQSSQTLFFSSNGLQNLGGFDVYKSDWTGRDWTTPQHMGVPLNSSYDDLYFSFDSESATGVFSSNRPGCLCADSLKNCKCSDIYTYPIVVDVKALVFNSTTGNPLNGATVLLRDLTTGIVDTVAADLLANDCLFPLQLERSYRLVASKEGWQSDSIEFNTKGIYISKHFEEKLYLKPEILLEVYVFDAITRLPLYGVNTIFTELGGQGDIRKTNETGNDFYYTLLPDRKYQIFAQKEFYSDASGDYNTAGIYEPRVIKDYLYLNPFDKPLVLYFDNDHPNPRTRTTTTTITYGESFAAYYDTLRRRTYEVEYSRPLTQQAAKDEAVRTIRDFFENEVKPNYEKLNGFCELLASYAASGQSFDITVEGFASPIANPEYNNLLTQRRIVCVINHLKQWKKGDLNLQTYFDNGQLKIVPVAHGEEMSTPGVSADPRDRRNSVYSVGASKDRRVQIQKIVPVGARSLSGNFPGNEK